MINPYHLFQQLKGEPYGVQDIYIGIGFLILSGAFVASIAYAYRADQARETGEQLRRGREPEPRPDQNQGPPGARRRAVQRNN